MVKRYAMNKSMRNDEKVPGNFLKIQKVPYVMMTVGNTYIARSTCRSPEPLRIQKLQSQTVSSCLFVVNPANWSDSINFSFIYLDT